MEKLIITGWGNKDYACAAAVALRHFKNADVIGMSTRRLPEYLSEVTGYTDIVILGVNLTSDVILLEKALKKLKAKAVKVTWISSFTMPDFVAKKVGSLMKIFVVEDDLPEVVSSYYKVPCKDIMPITDVASKDKRVKLYHLLIEASMYVYRNYQDEKAYGSVIRHIANGDSEELWKDSEKQMVEHYKRYGSRELIGKSDAIHELQNKINMAAGHPHARVLIFGESGTGKETVALQIHNKSPRQNEPCIAFNCASVTPNLLESRFFGYEKGAFTGANETKIGLFEQANGGTLFLDEIAELPLEAQGILLRVLEGGRFTSMGGKDEIEVNVRLIAATNKDLAAMVRDGKFREDLFHRLNVVQIRVPPLREHIGDLEQIANAYWQKQHHRKLEQKQIMDLMAYDYPGNVRELFNLLERASVLDEHDFAKLISEHREMTKSLGPTRASDDEPDELEAAIRIHIKRVYNKYNGNLSKAANALKAARNTVRKYLE